jgi:hypothetical protein
LGCPLFSTLEWEEEEEQGRGDTDEVSRSERGEEMQAAQGKHGPKDFCRQRYGGDRSSEQHGNTGTVAWLALQMQSWCRP